MAVDEAGEHGAAGRVDLHVRAGVGLEAGDPPAGERHVAALERELRRAVVAEVGESRLGRP